MSPIPTFGEYEGKKAYFVANEAAQRTFNVYLFEQVAMGSVNSIERLLYGGIPSDLLDDSTLVDSTLHW